MFNIKFCIRCDESHVAESWTRVEHLKNPIFEYCISFNNRIEYQWTNLIFMYILSYMTILWYTLIQNSLIWFSIHSIQYINKWVYWRLKLTQIQFNWIYYYIIVLLLIYNNIIMNIELMLNCNSFCMSDDLWRLMIINIWRLWFNGGLIWHDQLSYNSTNTL